MCQGKVVLPLDHCYVALCFEITGVPSLLCCSFAVVKWIKMLLKLLIIHDDNLHRLEKTKERPCGLGVDSLPILMVCWNK